jgi:endonuclease/exonuclease/phosphatase family metal-dependent hydrolase
MPELVVSSFNVEWMNDWFIPGAGPAAFRQQFRDRDDFNYFNDTAATAAKTASVIKAIDPDLLAVEEAPSRASELQLFVDTYLLDAGGQPLYQVILGDSGAAQKLGLLYKPDSVTSAGLAPHDTITGLIDPWMSDVDGDAYLEPYSFTRTPLVVDLEVGAQKLQLIVAHTKSNYINHGRQMWNDPNQQHEYIVTALKDRRRISSEAMRMRSYLDSVLDQTPDARVIVMGDLNDGPGLDYFETNYLTHNLIDILFGSLFQPEQTFRHAQHDVPADERYTAQFDDFVENIADRKLLLDHIMYSQGLESGALSKVPNSGAIRHAEYDAAIDPGGTHRENRPSDHRPVTMRLQY